jgi:NADPH-dependent curcumin reductase CurA
MSGFVIFDYANRYPEGVAQLAKWLNTGQLRSHEHVEHGDIGQLPRKRSSSSLAARTPASSSSL